MISRTTEPERALLMAMLAQALKDTYLGSKDERLSALRWLRSDSERPFGSRWICEELEMSWDQLQTRIGLPVRRHRRIEARRSDLRLVA